MKKNTVFTRLLFVLTVFAALPSILHADFMDNIIIKKTKIGLSAASAVAIKAASGMADNYLVDIPKMLMDGAKLEEKVYNVTRPITSIHMKHGGILLVNKGRAFTLSCISRSSDAAKTICNYEKERKILNLGTSSKGRDEKDDAFNYRSSLTIFRLTYVDILPHIEVGGRAFVHVSHGSSLEKNVIKLTGSSMLVCSSMDVQEARIFQSGLSRLKIDGLKAETLDLALQNQATALINGLVVRSANIASTGASSSKPSSVTLNGSAQNMELMLGNYSKYFGDGCSVKNLNLQVKRLFGAASVNCSELMSIKGTKGAAHVEYSGNPIEIKNEAGLDLRRTSLLGGAMNKFVDTVVDTFASRQKTMEKPARNHANIDAEAELAPLVE
jgi:hypothetical protein